RKNRPPPPLWGRIEVGGPPIPAFPHKGGRGSELGDWIMPQTAMQKILAAHSGKKSVEPGEFIMAKVDLAMANDITAPISIKALERAGITKLWDKDRIAIVFSHFVPAKDILSAAQAAVAREFCQKYDITLFFDEGRGGIEHSLL